MNTMFLSVDVCGWVMQHLGQTLNAVPLVLLEALKQLEDLLILRDAVKCPEEYLRQFVAPSHCPSLFCYGGKVLPNKCYTVL